MSSDSDQSPRHDGPTVTEVKEIFENLVRLTGLPQDDVDLLLSMLGGCIEEACGAIHNSVLRLECKNCGVLLCRRGMLVFLLSDPSVLVFSSDFICKTVLQGDRLRTDLPCECRALETKCCSCHRVVGYHVLSPCNNCAAGPHNNHYWIFDDNVVPRLQTTRGCDAGDALMTPLEWNTLGPPESDAARLIFTTSVPCTVLDTLRCPLCMDICVSCVMLPVCGHSFCELCGFRVVDVFRRCPLCSASTEGAFPVPNFMVRSAVDEMEVRCRYGTQWNAQASCWEVRLDGCPCVMPLKEVRQHQEACSYRAASDV